MTQQHPQHYEGILQHLKNVQQFVGYATLATSLKSLQHLFYVLLLGFILSNIVTFLLSLQYLQHFFKIRNTWGLIVRYFLIFFFLKIAIISKITATPIYP